MTGFLKKISILLLITCCFFTCEEPTNNTPTKPTTENSKPKPTPPKDCEIQGTTLEGNRIHFANQNKWVCIVATDSTRDEKLGDSHRILQVYNAQNCQLLHSVKLPVNRSPDFPYYIADLIFNKSSNLVAIKGHQSIFCYDVKNKKLLDELKPTFLNKRIGVDASSGMIKHLEVWENYLIGYAQDFGVFVFDLTDLAAPKALLPSAEFDVREGEQFTSLFLLQSQNGELHQAILPSFNFENRKLNVNPLFEAPQNVKSTIPKNVSDNRFIVLKNSEGIAFAIDMKEQKNVALPDDLKKGDVGDILSWLKK